MGHGGLRPCVVSSQSYTPVAGQTKNVLLTILIINQSFKCIMQNWQTLSGSSFSKKDLVYVISFISDCWVKQFEEVTLDSGKLWKTSFTTFYPLKNDAINQKKSDRLMDNEYNHHEHSQGKEDLINYIPLCVGLEWKPAILPQHGTSTWLPKAELQKILFRFFRLTACINVSLTDIN